MESTAENRMSHRKVWLALLSVLCIAVGTAHAGDIGRSAPELTHRDTASWLNSAPLSLADLRGKVVLVEFWTFDCINCLRSLDWMTQMAARGRNSDLVVLGVHTPELPREKVPANVAAAVKRLGIDYPVMIDADYSYWKALGNQYWPAFFLIDRNGRLHDGAIGEMHVGEARAKAFEDRIQALLDKG